MGAQQLLASYGAAAPPATQTWNPAHKSSIAVLSAADLRLTSLTSGGSYAVTRGTKACAGLCYFSMLVGFTASGSVCGGGVADATTDLTNSSNFPGIDSKSIELGSPNGSTFFNNTNIGSAGTLSNPDNIEVAVRVATRRVWVRQNGGSWVGGGDPAADTSPTATLTGSGDIFPAAWVTSSGTSASRYVEINPTAGTTTGTVPSGFTAANWA
jgi:hypothetical protein